MRQLTQNYKTGEMALTEVPGPVLQPGGVLVQTLFSVVSAGTERSKVDLAKKGLIGKAKARPDLVKQVLDKVRQEGIGSTFQKVMGKLDSLSPLGYSSAGVVMQVGERVDAITEGDLVACAGAGYANHAEVVWIPKHLVAKIPDDVSLEHASFATIGAIALQGVRQGGALLGENVAVIGLGLLGQLTVQMLKAQGCNVLGVDIDSAKVELAKHHGADAAGVRGRDDIERLAKDFTSGLGVDVVIICAASPNADPVELAGAIARDKGRVVVVGASKIEVPREPYYKKELELRLSRSYGPGRYDPSYEEHGHDYPPGYVRWTENRNMQQFLAMVNSKQVNLDKIITHRFFFNEAIRAYDVITGGAEKPIGVVLKYSQDQRKPRQRVQLHENAVKPGPTASIGLGVIGAGSFARSVLLPKLRLPGVEFNGITTASGLTARDVAEKLGFKYCASSPEEILSDPNVNTLLLATRHDTHAALVIDGLRAGKNVFVEKPLAMNMDELKAVIRATETNNRLLVGFNRRFAPLSLKAKQHFEGRKGPIVINCRVNAGAIPSDHWIQQVDVGGGRIIGEVCHFIDLCHFFVGTLPGEISASGLLLPSQPIELTDNVSIGLKFADGSLANVTYVADGDTAAGKERIEIFGQGRTAFIDDFRVGHFYRNGKKDRSKTFAQDKGHADELRAFVDSVSKGSPMPITLEELISSSYSTLRVIDALRKGTPVSCDLQNLWNDQEMG